MKKGKRVIKLRNTALLSLSWQQWYSWFEEWPTGGSTMQERNTTAQKWCKNGGPICNMHQRGTAFCHSFLTK